MLAPLLACQSPAPPGFGSTPSFAGHNTLARPVPFSLSKLLSYNQKVNIRRGPWGSRFFRLGVPASGKCGDAITSFPVALKLRGKTRSGCKLERIRLSGAHPVSSRRMLPDRFEPTRRIRNACPTHAGGAHLKCALSGRRSAGPLPRLLSWGHGKQRGSSCRAARRAGQKR
jgi:hypothetical protein